MTIGPIFSRRQRISTLLFIILASIACLVLAGLIVMALRLVEIRTELGELRDSALPRLVKLSQLSQEASATISIAPALSAKPTRFEFETLLSRIKDKESSQTALIAELGGLIQDTDAARVLKRNSDLLTKNLLTLTDVVSQQINVRKRLEKHIEYFRARARNLSQQTGRQPAGGTGTVGNTVSLSDPPAALANTVIFKILNTLLDPSRARFSRNKRQVAAGFDRMTGALGADPEPATPPPSGTRDIARKVSQYWSANSAAIYKDKNAELNNEFRIKALVEENALIVNRLLSSAKNEFWSANTALQSQFALANETARFTLVSIVVVVAAFGAGIFLVGLVLQRRVFRRLGRMRTALEGFAENRDRAAPDPVADEIGEISESLIHYMTVIDEREAELAEKTNAMEQLSNQLAKYLSPQVYESIFSGRREVKLASSRKKLTVFFSDIASFTETADRLESEELTQLLNQYLTEMSRIALDHGATIDKYVGDAILIFFGDPETRGVKEDALACVRMAIAMRSRLLDLQDIWRQSGIERPLRCRMGIHTGFCTVGNFGSEDRMDYTIIGGAVNTASRLESLATPGEILISFETFAHVRDEILCEEHGEAEVKGIAYPVATYQVVDSHVNLGELKRRFREEHPNVTLDLNLDSMTADDRSRAETVLRQGLELLKQTEDHRSP